MLSEGAVFAGRFRVARALAAGGMGAVYEVVDERSGRRRALKVMLPHLVKDAAQRRRFDAEVRVGARIRSEHVVEVFDAGVDEASGMPWLLMELLAGETLEGAVQRGGPMAPGQFVKVFAQLGHALGAAHRAGVLHMDLKPANIFLWTPDRADAGRTVKVLDFGIARVVETGRTAAELTTAGGTVAWMAPEQSSRGGQVRPSVDVWSLGLIAYYALTGREHWRASSVPEVEFNARALLVEVLFEPLAAASQRAAEQGVAGLLPAGFDAWFARCVVREPERRWRDADEAVTALLTLFNTAPGLRAVAPTVVPFGLVATPSVSSTVPSIPPGYAKGPTDLAWGARAAPHPPRRGGGGALYLALGVTTLLLAAGTAWWLLPSSRDTTLNTPPERAAAASRPTVAMPPISPVSEPPAPAAVTPPVVGAAPVVGAVPPPWGSGPMPHYVSVSSHALTRGEFHPSVDAFDGALETAWNDGVAGDPRGQWIEAEYEQPQRIRGFRITTGWLHTTRRGQDLFTANTRIRTLRVAADGRELGRWEVPDGTREIFVSTLDASARRFRFEVLDVWWGARYQDLAVSEIALIAPPEERAEPWFIGWRVSGQESYRGHARCLRDELRTSTDLRLRSSLTLLGEDVAMGCNRGDTSSSE